MVKEVKSSLAIAAAITLMCAFFMARFRPLPNPRLPVCKQLPSASERFVQGFTGSGPQCRPEADLATP
jgi:hypothetical protein